MYSKVIVPLDGSDLAEGALPYAQLVAGALSLPVELVEAFDVLDPAVQNQSSRLTVHEMVAEAQRGSRIYFSGVRERLITAGCDADVTTLPGLPEQVIMERADADPHALVVMSTHGRGGIARWALGSVADKVLHSVPNPMLIVRAGAAPPEVSVHTVLVPLDGSELAESSLAHAVNLARALDAGMVLVRVSQTADHYRSHLGGRMRRLTTFGDSLEKWADDLAEGDAAEAESYLAELRGRLAMEFPQMNRVRTRHLRHDDVAQAIIDTAASEPSLVVMSTHGRSGIGRLVLGSVTDRVVRHSETPVLAVHG